MTKRTEFSASRLLAMCLMSKHLESDVKNIKKKKSFGKASFCVHVTRTIVKDVRFFFSCDCLSRSYHA